MSLQTKVILVNKFFFELKITEVKRSLEDQN